MLRIDAFQEPKILVNLDALVKVVGHLFALGDLVGSQQSVVVETLSVGPLVGEAGQFLVGLIVMMLTLYSWNSNGTSLHLLRWFSGRSLR